MSADTTVVPTDDPVAALLVASAVGFATAGVRVGAVARLRDFAGDDTDSLERARTLLQAWSHVGPEARMAALHLLARAAHR